MSPTDATTPEALFGAEALEDRRALKRAYARLVRQHPPEADPEVFAHVRRLYEQAVEELGQGRRTRVTVGETPEAEHDLDALVAGITAETWPEGVEALGRRADAGDLDALQAGYGILVAVAPERAIPWLHRGVERPGGPDRIVDLLRATFALVPGRARDPLLEPLLDALPADAVRKLRVGRLEALATFHPARAVVFWRIDQAALVQDPDALTFLLHRVVPHIRWHLAPDELDDLMRLAEDARLPLSDEMVRFLHVALHAARAAHDLPEDLRPVHEALRFGHRRERPHQAQALRDLARWTDDPEELMRRLDASHPGVSAALRDMLDQVTRCDASLIGWAATGEPRLPPDGDAVLHEVAGLMERVEEEVPPPPRTFADRLPERGALIGIALTLLMGLVMLAAGGVGSWVFLTASASERALDGAQSVGVMLLGGALIATAGWLASDVWGKMKMKRLLADEDPWSAEETPRARAMGEALVRAAAPYGRWPHEVAGALEALRGRAATRAVEPWLGQAAVQLDLIDDAHVRRVVTEAAREAEAQAQAEREAAEQAVDPSETPVPDDAPQEAPA